MNNNRETQVQMIADYEGDVTKLITEKKPGAYPILCTRGLVLFPTVLTPIVLGRSQSVALLEHMRQQKTEDPIFCSFCQKDEEVEIPEQKDLSEIGVFCRLIKMIDLPGPEKQTTIVVQALGRCRLNKITQTHPYYEGEVESIPEIWPKKGDSEFKILQQALYNQTIDLIHASEDMSNEAEYALNNISNPLVRPNFIFSSMPYSIEEKLKLLSINKLNDRITEAIKMGNKLMQLFALESDIRRKTKSDLDEQQREYFLQQQLKNIKEELGGNESNPEKKEIIEKAKNKKWNEKIEKTFQKEYKKLDTINPQSPDYPIQINYLQTLVDLPWDECTKDDLSLKHAKKVLDKDHYGMEKVKERILEYLAVRALRDDQKSPILCLYGPPGVGKTSLGKSIAEAMKRKYVRVSLGGLHDEAEIRGHRRTYIGAMPGRIIKSIQKAGSGNPVFILDEIERRPFFGIA